MPDSKTNSSHRTTAVATVCLVTAFFACPANARSHSLLLPRSYDYHRRPSMDLMSDIFSMPLYNFNSLFRQQQEQAARFKQALTDDGPSYHVQELPSGDVVLQMDVPGVSAKDLKVELIEDGTVLRITGSRHHHGSVSEFERQFRIDNDVDADNLSVRLASGVLHISAPKKEKVTKQLTIVEDVPEHDVVEAHVEKVFEEVDGMIITTEDQL